MTTNKHIICIFAHYHNNMITCTINDNINGIVHAITNGNNNGSINN